MMEAEVLTLTVSQLTRRIRLLLEDAIGEVWVEGEVSNLRVQSSGHQYFTLKDETAQLSCVLFRANAGRLGTALRDGMQVRVFGTLTVYEQRGAYQVIVRVVQPRGVGALQAKFEALKQKLAAEGLFDQEWKKAIPRHPKCVALVTSPSGAAVRDMLQILERRSPWLHVLVFPVRVQGQGAEVEIARALEVLNRAQAYGIPAPDTIVVARGGGSLEDLWSFNEELVARAIFASEIPVISAVGHEIDFTIADFVADLRAPTPSAAAELLAPDGAEMQRHFEAVGRRLSGLLAAVLERAQRELDLLGRGALQREPERLLREAEQDVDALEEALTTALGRRWERLAEWLTGRRLELEKHRPALWIAGMEQRVIYLSQRMAAAIERQADLAARRVEALAQLLKSLGPEAVLARGFSVTTDAGGRVISDPAQVRTGERVMTKVAAGRFESVVTVSGVLEPEAPPHVSQTDPDPVSRR